MKYTEKELLRIWVNSFININVEDKNFILSIIDGAKSISGALEKNKQSLIEKIGEEKFNNLLSNANGEYLKSILTSLEELSIIAVTDVSSSYPEKLKKLKEPPVCLYAKGDISLLKEDALSIVGSRKSLPISISACEEFTKEIVDSDIYVVTGIAEGVDITAVKTALKNNGKVISVIAGGLDSIYPKAHTEIANEIAKKGLIVSEQPVGAKAQPFMFPFRNRIIAALGKCALIVSAGEKSGTLYTAEYAKNLNKKVFAFPYNVGVPSGKGCNGLIKNGATLVDEPDEIIKEFNKQAKKSSKIILTDEESKIVAAIKSGQTHVEQIALAVGKKAFTLFPVLSMLEIKGIIVKNGVNVFGLTLNGLEE